MRSFTLTLISQVLVVLVTIASVGAGPLYIQRRKNLEVYVPTILQPTAASIWKAGGHELVAWNTTDAPPSISNEGHVALRTVTADPKKSVWRHLAGPFDLTMGQIKVTVPDDVTSGSYTIILFGDSGNASPTFQVDGISPSEPQPNDNSTPASGGDNETTK